MEFFLVCALITVPKILTSFESLKREFGSTTPDICFAFFLFFVVIKSRNCCITGINMLHHIAPIRSEAVTLATKEDGKKNDKNRKDSPIKDDTVLTGEVYISKTVMEFSI
jgi:hypothetical protein